MTVRNPHVRNTLHLSLGIFQLVSGPLKRWVHGLPFYITSRNSCHGSLYGDISGLGATFFWGVDSVVSLEFPLNDQLSCRTNSLVKKHRNKTVGVDSCAWSDSVVSLVTSKVGQFGDFS